jgi:hypothetical protein
MNTTIVATVMKPPSNAGRDDLNRSERVHVRSGSQGWEMLFLFMRGNNIHLHQPWELSPSLSFSGKHITNIIDCESTDPVKKAAQLKVDLSHPICHTKEQLCKNLKVSIWIFLRY